MKRVVLFWLAWAGVLVALHAQKGIPQKSPRAYAGFKVGLTEVSVQYSSPAVRGRVIWGGIVPYHKVWRAGANQATVVSFDTPVLVGGTQLDAGDYSFFLIPKPRGRWTAIFNAVADQWGAFLYNDSLDVVRLEVRVEEMDQHVERLRYHIEDYSLEEGAIVMSWEQKRVVIPFYVSALAPAIAAWDTLIQNMHVSEQWYFLAEEADMMHEMGMITEAEKKLAESLALGEHVWNLWKHARFLAHKGKYEEAYKVIGRMKVLATSGDLEESRTYTNLESEVNEAMKTWKAHQNRLLEINKDIWIPFAEAYASGEAEKYLTLHSPHFIRASENGRLATDLNGYSKNVWRSFNRNEAKGGKTTIEFRFTERFASEDAASEKGIYRYTFLSKSDETITGYGKFHVVSRKEDGTWKILMDYDTNENGTVGATEFEAAYPVHDIRKFDP